MKIDNTPRFDFAWSKKWQSNKWGSVDVDQIALDIGELDVRPPDAVKARIVEAAELSPSAYCWSPGIPSVRRAIADLYSQRGRCVDEKHIYLTQGTKLGLKLAFEALLSEGDRIVVAGSPAYKLIVSGAQLRKVDVVYVPLVRGNGSWHLDLDALRDATEANVRAIIFNNPHNPTGHVFTQSEVDAVACAALRSGAIIVADEINEFLTFDAEHISLAQVAPELRQKTLTFSSFSKAFGIGGYRVGHLLHDGPLMSEIEQKLKQRLIQASTLSQFAAWGCADAASEWLPPLKNLISKNLDLCEAALRPFIKSYVRPLAGFSLWIPLPPDCSIQNVADDILSEARVRVLDQRGYEHTSERGFRISFGTQPEILSEALMRLKKYLTALT